MKVTGIHFIERIMLLGICLILINACSQKDKEIGMNLTAADILGNPDYLAISYGGYRENTREVQPTIEQIKEDMKILAAMGVKILRTYNVQYEQASNIIRAINQLKREEANFEMYVMLGVWIDCKNAWTHLEPDHELESEDNAAEISRAVTLANQYPDIVKIIAVGNEAMVKWATSYYVQPSVILKWVNHLQDLKQSRHLPEDLWITSSDNFASWGGGGDEYHVEDLEKLMKAVDYISIHTYPMHDTHYNPVFWQPPENETEYSEMERIDAAMLRSTTYAKTQYQAVVDYMKGLGLDKAVHIGETGWASVSNGHYGPNGSKAADEYKEGLYYKQIRRWTNEANISCFYFEAFDEQWKDHRNKQGSENHFGLINLKGEAKYALWDLVDKGVFKGLTRDGQDITKTFNGVKDALMKTVSLPPIANETATH